MDETKDPGLLIAQVFLLRAWFEHREDVLDLPHNTPVPELKIDVRTRIGFKPDDSEGIIILTVQTSDKNENPLYRFLVEIAGSVKQEATKNMGVQEYLTKNGTAMLYPFLREVVANLTLRGRFGPVWLKPINTKLSQTVAREGATQEVQT